VLSASNTIDAQTAHIIISKSTEIENQNRIKKMIKRELEHVNIQSMKTSLEEVIAWNNKHLI